MKTNHIFFTFVLSVFSLCGATQLTAQPSNALRLPLYVIETTGVPERAEDAASYMPSHLAHQVELEKRGILFGAGGLRSENPEAGAPASGLIIIRANSFEEARQIADSDPMHANGLRTYTIRRWSLNEGRVNIQIDFSDQSVIFE